MKKRTHFQQKKADKRITKNRPKSHRKLQSEYDRSIVSRKIFGFGKDRLYSENVHEYTNRVVIYLVGQILGFLYRKTYLIKINEKI